MNQTTSLILTATLVILSGIAVSHESYGIATSLGLFSITLTLMIITEEVIKAISKIEGLIKNK